MLNWSNVFGEICGNKQPPESVGTSSLRNLWDKQPPESVGTSSLRNLWEQAASGICGNKQPPETVGTSSLRNLWEQAASGNPEVPWLKEIEEKFKQMIPNVDEGDLNATNEICWETILKKKNWSAPGPDKITNFWWKKLTCVIKFISNVFRAICNALLVIERWVCTGRVSLVPKPGDWSESNQRPITCLNTLYKWITSVLRNFHNEHIKKYELLQIDQRGVKQKSSGTMCNLLVDDMVLRDAKLHHRNLFCYWIDVRKAFDSVSHSWLIKMLEIHRFPNKFTIYEHNVKLECENYHSSERWLC